MMKSKKSLSPKEAGSIKDENIQPKVRLGKPIILMIILSLITFITFYGAFDNAFVNWDDQVYVEEQPLVLNKEYAALWKTPVSLNYHPLTMITLALQVPKDIKKLSPAPMIKLNVWLHIFNASLVFLFLWMINDKKWIVAFLTAAIFAIHPMHVESVVWVSERKDVLYTFFFLLASITYWQYVVTEKKKWLAFAFMLFVMSVLSKAMAVVLPIVFLMLDFWKGRKLTDHKVMVEKIPFLAVSLFFGLMAVSVQGGGDFGGLLSLYGEKSKAIADTDAFSLIQRFQFASYGFVQYILMFFNPTKICAFYPYPIGNKLEGLSAILYPLSTVAIIGFAIWSSLKTRIFAFGIGFYFVTIALVLQFLSVGLALMADRYSYIPYIGLAFLITYAADYWLAPKSVTLKYGWYSLVFVFICLLGVKTKTQVDVWQNSETLWSQAIKYYPKDDLILANRGNHRGKTGNIAGAMRDFEAAIADDCHRADVYEGLGNSYGTMSEQQPEKKSEYIGKAISMFNKALEIEPSNGQVMYNLGVAQLQTNPGESVKAFTEALKLMPYKEASILPVLGLSQLNSGNYQEAIKTLTKVISAGSATDAVFYYRGLANLGVGNRDAAKNDFDQALAINPGNIDAKTRLATM
jgi:protein O-mannosyl-transferase